MSTKLSIYVDLDETLIHSIQGFGRNPGKRTPIPFKGAEKYHSLLRPASLEMLATLRNLGKVRMLTTATREYAKAHNEVFTLGFGENEIVDREDYTSRVQLAYGFVLEPTRRKSDPQAVLIDNLSPESENSRIKIEYLGIDESRYFRIREFSGKDPDCFEAELKSIFSDIRRIVAQTKARHHENDGPPHP